MNNEKTAETLIKAFGRACDELGLDTTYKSELLGINRATLTRNKLKGFPPQSRTGEIQLNFIYLYRSLYTIASGDIEFMRHWFSTENTALKGTPADLCKKHDGMFLVNQYLDVMIINIGSAKIIEDQKDQPEAKENIEDL